jgi:hypothetical protein
MKSPTGIATNRQKKTIGTTCLGVIVILLNSRAGTAARRVIDLDRGETVRRHPPDWGDEPLAVFEER